MNLSTRKFFMYYLEAVKIEAMKQLRLCEAVSLPYLKRNEKKKIMNKYLEILLEEENKPDIESSWNILRRGAKK